MSAKELAQYLDRTGNLVIEQTALRPRVVVKDARSIFGRIELLVTPVAGDGEAWHEFEKSVKLDPVGGVK